MYLVTLVKLPAGGRLSDNGVALLHFSVLALINGRFVTKYSSHVFYLDRIS